MLTCKEASILSYKCICVVLLMPEYLVACSNNHPRMEALKCIDRTIHFTRNAAKEQDLTQVKSLVHLVKPEWTLDDIKTKTLSGGHINCIVKVWQGEDEDGESLIVRVYSPLSIIRETPSTLVTVMRAAEAGGVGASVLAQFNNGLIYKYTKGDVILPDIYPHDAHIQNCRRVCRFHSLNVDDVLPPEESSTLSKEPYMFRLIYHCLSLIQETDFEKITYKNRAPKFSREEFMTELHFVEEAVEKLEGDEVVFCHNDVWWGNQVYDNEKDRVRFIDLDHANYNYVTRDIAFYMFEGKWEIKPNKICQFHKFRESEKQSFYKAYLEKRRQLEKNKLKRFSDEMILLHIEKLLKLERPMEMGVALDRVIVFLFLNSDESTFDYIWAANACWDNYQILKEELNNITDCQA